MKLRLYQVKGRKKRLGQLTEPTCFDLGQSATRTEIALDSVREGVLRGITSRGFIQSQLSKAMAGARGSARLAQVALGRRLRLTAQEEGTVRAINDNALDLLGAIQKLRDRFEGLRQNQQDAALGSLGRLADRIRDLSLRVCRKGLK